MAGITEQKIMETLKGVKGPEALPAIPRRPRQMPDTPTRDILIKRRARRRPRVRVLHAPWFRASVP